MPFRIGSLKTLNYESRLDNMTDEGHLRPFYDTSKIRNTPFEAVRTIRVTPQNGDPVINHNLDSQGSLVLNRGEYLLETVVSTMLYLMFNSQCGVLVEQVVLK